MKMNNNKQDSLKVRKKLKLTQMFQMVMRLVTKNKNRKIPEFELLISQLSESLKLKMELQLLKQSEHLKLIKLWKSMRNNIILILQLIK